MYKTVCAVLRLARSVGLRGLGVGFRVRGLGITVEGSRARGVSGFLFLVSGVKFQG